MSYRKGSVGLFVLTTLACSSSGASGSTGVASISGGGIVPVKSAALLSTDAIIDGAVGAQTTTYVQLYASAPGASCGTLDAGSVIPTGSLQIGSAPGTLLGQTVTIGGSRDVFLTLNSASTPDAGGASDAGDAGLGPPSLVATSGTITFQAGPTLTGAIDVQMVVSTEPGTPSVHVTGSFTAPTCD
jgi:hypothetical protein